MGGFVKRKMTRRNWKGLVLSILGINGFIINYKCFIAPMGLYAGGFTGLAQVFVDILQHNLNVTIPASVDLTGILMYLINIPLLLMGYRELGHRFFSLSLICIIVQSTELAFVPALATPVFSDPLLNAIIGGLISGLGVGITLKAGGSGGGTDILGMYFAKKSPGSSVGRLSIAINACVYTYAAFTKDIDIAAYSLIMSVATGLAMDRVHDQNILLDLIVITRNPEMGQVINKDAYRGVTSWKGRGEYERKEQHLFMVVMNKYEYNRIRRRILEVDPNAFIIVLSPQSLIGNFDKHLDVA